MPGRWRGLTYLLTTLLAGGPAGEGVSAAAVLRPGEAVCGYFPSPASLPSRYTFWGEAGQQVVVLASSQHLATSLALVDPVGNPVASQASAGDGNARIALTLPATGDYTVTLQPHNGEGPYLVSLETPALGRRGIEGLALPGTAVIRESLRWGDPTLPDGSYYHTYSFDAREGQQAVIELTSGDFDAYLILAFDGDELVDIAQDDDSAGGTNARIKAELPSTGRYILLATSYSGDERGEYRLWAQVLPPGPLSSVMSSSPEQTCEPSPGSDPASREGWGPTGPAGPGAGTGALAAAEHLRSG